MTIAMRLAAVLILLWTSPLAAQPYPTKPIRVVVPFAAGGIADLYARIIGARVTDAWGQPVVIENRTGAGGNIGADAVAKSPPDGYTLVMSALGPHAVNVSLFAKMPYDPVRDFAPIALVLEAEGLLVVHPSIPVNSVGDLITHARSNPGKLTFASAGMGTASHLAGELFKSMAQVDMVHVPYKGSGPSFQDLLANVVSLTSDSVVQALPYIRQGQLKALAVLGPKRLAVLPDVPTVGETVVGYELTNWFGLVAPVATPKDVLAKIHADTAKVLQQAEVREKFATMGADAVGNSPEEFGRQMKNDSAKWARIIQEANIRAE